MANEFQQAADDAKRLLAGFAGVATIAAALEKVGGVIQAQEEAEKRLADLTDQAKTAQEQLALANLSVDAAKLDAQGVAAAARDAADQVVVAANNRAAEIIEKANADVAAAQERATALMDSANEKVAQSQAKVDELTGAASDLEARVTQARAYLAKIAGNTMDNKEPFGPYFTYHVECVGADGEVKWVEEYKNLVTTVGKTDIIDKYFKGAAYTASWFLGLKGTGTAVVGDTASSHAGWAEVNPYAGNRPAITFGTTSGGSNTATAVSYSINATATVAGAFVQSVNTGTTGTLYSAGDFGSARSVISGDTLNVTLTVSAT